MLKKYRDCQEDPILFRRDRIQHYYLFHRDKNFGEIELYRIHVRPLKDSIVQQTKHSFLIAIIIIHNTFFTEEKKSELQNVGFICTLTQTNQKQEKPAGKCGNVREICPKIIKTGKMQD